MENIEYHQLFFNKSTGKFESKIKLKFTPFIKGPIPLPWIICANSLPGKSGAVGLAIWFISGVRCNKTVKLTQDVERIAGCHRKAVYAAISNLEQAGLIHVERRHGARPTVTILVSDPS